MAALRSPMVWQAAALAILLLVIALVPPRRGALLLVALDGDAGRAVRVGVAAGAAVMRLGPLPGSVVMWGERGRLAAPLRAAGVLMLAAPPGGCGAGVPEQG